MLAFAFTASLISQLCAGPLTTADAKATPSPTPEPRFKIYGWVDTGITFNPAGPGDHQNFGRLFDDRSNEPLLNQAVITFERTLDPKVGFDWGFKAQFLFGTDRATSTR